MRLALKWLWICNFLFLGIIGMIVGLDIDNVIADLDEIYLEYFIEEDKNKRNAGIINQNARHITDGMFDWSKEEVIDFISDKMDEMGGKLKVISGAKNCIDKLKKDNHKVYLLTHRINRYWKNPENITKYWLEKNGIQYDKLIFTKTTDKSPECKENDVDIMFDDSVNNCIHLTKAGVPCYVFKTRYNEDYKKHLKMVYNWEEVYEIICKKSQKLKVILDTDTYNECDDQFALTYMLKSLDKFDVQAITVAPYSHPEFGETIIDGLDKSYDEICKISNWLSFDIKDKVFKGATNYLKDGITDNDAVNKIIEISLSNDKTYIMAIGAITNIAMAILKEPKIVDKIEIIWLGGNSLLSYDNMEYNFKQDVEAVKVVFESQAKLTIIPAKGVASNLMTSIYELEHHLKGKSEICNYLCQTFYKDGYHEVQDRRVIWDISVIAYLINEHWFETKEINCPNINKDTSYDTNTDNHKITMVNYMNAKFIYKDLFAKLKNT